MFSAISAFTLGVLLFQQMPFLPSSWWLLVLAPGWICWRACRRLRPVLLLLLGFSWSHFHALLNRPAPIPDHYLGQPVWVTGIVKGLPEDRPGRSRFFFEVESLALKEKHLSGSWRIRLNWYRQIPPLHSGERWKLPVKLKPVHSYRNPGGFDYAGWLYARGVIYTGYVKGKGGLRLSAASPLASVRQQLAQGIGETVASSRAAGVMRALLVGDRSGLSAADKATFAATGTSHLMAISGLHIGLVAGLAFLLARRLWRCFPRLCARWPAPVAAAPVAMLAALGYAALAGFSVPTERALIMLWVAMLGIVWRRTVAPFHALALALLLVLLWDPLAVISAGFWLSFTAVAVILLMAPGGGRFSWLWLQLAISLALAPLLVWQQMQLSLLSPLVNLLAIPLFSLLLVPLVLSGGLLLFLWPEVGEILLQGARWLLDVLLPLLDQLAAVNPPFSGREAGVQLLVVLTAGLLFGSLLWRRGMNWSVLLVVPIVALAVGFAAQSARPQPNSFDFALLDVGQGLSAVVITARHTLVFDTGPRFDSGFNTGAAVVVPYLEQRGLSRIDMLVISHGDMDHVGGAKGVLNRLPAERIISGEPLAIGRRVHRCQAGDQWWWDGVHFQLLHPPSGRRLEGNRASCVVRVSSGRRSVLLTGDIEADGEQWLVKHYGNRLASTLVVAAHHGSNTSSSSAFIQKTGSDYVLFAAGIGNRWGFPSAKVMTRWCKQGAEPLNTAWSGALEFTLSADTLSGPRHHAQRQRRYWQSQIEKKIPPACSMISADK